MHIHIHTHTAIATSSNGQVVVALFNQVIPATATAPASTLSGLMISTNAGSTWNGLQSNLLFPPNARPIRPPTLTAGTFFIIFFVWLL